MSFGGDNLSALLRRVKDEASPLYLQAGHPTHHPTTPRRPTQSQ
jgi:hypothetical protein